MSAHLTTWMSGWRGSLADAQTTCELLASTLERAPAEAGRVVLRFPWRPSEHRDLRRFYDTFVRAGWWPTLWEHDDARCELTVTAARKGDRASLIAAWTGQEAST